MAWFFNCYYETKMNGEVIFCTAQPLVDKMITFYVRELKS